MRIRGLHFNGGSGGGSGTGGGQGGGSGAGTVSNPDNGGQGGANPNPAPNNTSQNQPAAQDTATARELADLKAKFAALETQHAEVSGKWKAHEDSQKTEAQKAADALAAAEKRAADNETAAKAGRVQMAIERQARTLGIVDEDAAYKLLDTSKITYDTNGAPSNIEDLLKQLITAKPYLTSATGTQQARTHTGNPTNPSKPASTPGTTFTVSQCADRAFYLANQKEIMKAMAEGRIVQG